MRQQQVQVQGQTGQARDDRLRRAHQIAFEEIRAATKKADARAAITAAVEHLIDACENYVEQGKASYRGAA